MSKKCSACGKPGHYAKTCNRGEDTKPGTKAAKKKRKAKSWLKMVENKLDEAAEQVTPDEEKTPSAGEPFADLPNLEVPTSAPETQEEQTSDTEAAGGTASTNTASPPDEKKASPKAEGVHFDTKEIADMAGSAMEDVVNLMAKYAAERGFMALGGPFAKMANTATKIIVNKRAADMQIDEEEAAAYVLLGIVGFNGVQDFRAFKAEEEAIRKAKANEQRAAATANQAKHVANGVTPTEQRQRVAEQRLVTSPGIV